MNTSHPSEFAVEATGLMKRYRSTVAVDGITIRVRHGEVFGILGANGAGKTTTVEMLAGLRRPTSGEVRIMGFDPLTHHREVRQLLGVQLQEAYLHGALTCRELINLYRSFYPAPLGTDEALKLVDLVEKSATRFDDLSGGQQQRLSVALALIGRPRVVILDELTTGLDPRARRRIWSALEALEDITIILISHAMDEVERLCDRVALLDCGRILAEGTVQELRELSDTQTLEEAFVTLSGGNPFESNEED